MNVGVKHDWLPVPKLPELLTFEIRAAFEHADLSSKCNSQWLLGVA
jgi:hypothetical protein